MKHRTFLLLDACALINLYASRHFPQIIGARKERFAIVQNVYREARFVFRGGDGLDSRTREPIDWPTLTSGMLDLLGDPTETEAALYFDLSLELGDGEAMTGAVAWQRGYGVVSDDRKATRLLGNLGIQVTSSLELVDTWARHDGIEAETLQRVITDIRIRARYIPARSHPYYEWWVESAGEHDR
ncbi:MAG: hypothetical protein H0T72_02970 [Chloroflexia bacterium]|nr:hypothetical protein [Chloroflexia bacterium]